MERESNLQVIIGDDACYFVNDFGATSLNLDFGISLHLSNILFVPGIRRNLIPISALEDKGYQVAFSEGRVLAWPKKSSIKYSHVIGNRYDNLYKLSIRLVQALLYKNSNSSELWHRRLGHLHFRALPTLEKMVKVMPKLSHVHNDTCKGCAMGKNTKNPFHKTESRSKEKLALVHSNLCGPMFLHLQLVSCIM